MKTFKQFLTERLAGELTIGRWNGKSAYQSPNFNDMDSDYQWDYDLYHDVSKNTFFALLDDDVPGEWAGEGKTLKDCVKNLLGNVQYQNDDACSEFAWAFTPDDNDEKIIKKNLKKLRCTVTVIATAQPQ